MRNLAVALAGALGALARHGLGNWLAAWLPSDFPVSTLLINLAGSALLGFVTGYGVERGQLPAAWRLPLTVGFIGSFTTFSTWSVDTVLLVEAGQWVLAALNVVLSLALGAGAVVVGHTLARRVAGGEGEF